MKSVVQREGVSINQFITIAIAEKLSALMTEEYLAALAEVPEVEPEEYDRLPTAGR